MRGYQPSDPDLLARIKGYVASNRVRRLWIGRLREKGVAGGGEGRRNRGLCGGGSPELAVTSVPKLGSRCGLAWERARGMFNSSEWFAQGCRGCSSELAGVRVFRPLERPTAYQN